MEIPLQISFKNMEGSETIESRIREKAAKLEQYFGRLTSCRVVVEAPHRHHHKGKIYHVHIDIGVPGHPDLVVSREPEENHAHEDVYVAIRDAFSKAQRQLQDFRHKMDPKAKRDSEV